MRFNYTHDPKTLKADIELIESLKGNVRSDCYEYYKAFDNVLKFTRWVAFDEKKEDEILALKRRKAMDDLVAQSQELGLYD